MIQQEDHRDINSQPLQKNKSIQYVLFVSRGKSTVVYIVIGIQQILILGKTKLKKYRGKFSRKVQEIVVLLKRTTPWQQAGTSLSD